MLLEVLISRLPVTSTWVLFPLAYSTTYTVFMTVFWSIDGNRPYDEVNAQKCRSLAFYAWAPILVIGFYALLCAFFAVLSASS